VDSHPESIKRARAFASRTGVSESTHFRVGNVFNLPYPERFFAVAIDYGCLHHLHKYDWERYLESITRVLKPEAFYMLTVYSLKDKHVRDRKRQYVVHQGHYDYFFNKKEIRELFDKNFQIIKIVEDAFVTPDGVKSAFYHVYMRKKILPKVLP
jgi:ubiquinone/menaquinone biosynthesis C-methylase UbiE